MNQSSYKLTFLSCLGIVIGSVIGSGIFVVPSIMISTLPSPMLIFLVWIVSGIVSIIGGLVVAGMGMAFPEANDLLDYFKVLFPQWVPFAFNIISNWIVNTCGTVAIAFMFAEYFGYFFHMDSVGHKITAIMLVLFLTYMNTRNMKVVDRFQIVFTAIKVAAILILIALLLIPGKGDFNNFNASEDIQHWSTMKIIGACIAACTGALNAFDGWYMVSYMTREVRGGVKTVSKSIVAGLMICMVLYLLATFAVHFNLTIEEVASSKLVAVTALEKVVGEWGSILISIFVLISTSSGVNSNLIASSRLLANSASQKMFFPYFAMLNHKGIPKRACWLIFSYDAILIATGTFEFFLDTTLFFVWLFVTTLTAGFLYIFIKRKISIPSLPRIPMIIACIVLIVFGLMYLGSFFFLL
jgi:APA family basic amino acid/polyamine antiporter